MAHGQKKRSDSRVTNLDAIVDAAAYLFDVRGFTETTVQDIADHLNISKPTIYSYTQGKLQILELIINRWIDESDQILDATVGRDDQATRVDQIVIEWTRMAAQNTAHLKTFLSAERNMPPSAVERYRNWSRKAYSTIRGFIIDGQKSGYYAADLDPTVTTFSILGYILLLPRWLDEKGPLSWRQVAEAYLATLHNGLSVQHTDVGS